MLKTFNDVKGIAMNVTFEGQGCVNFDGEEQIYYDKLLGLFDCYKDSQGKTLPMVNTKCMKLAKKLFKDCEVKDKNGNVTTETRFLTKVSSECIGNEMFHEVLPGLNPNIVTVPHLFYNTLAMCDARIHGWTFVGRNINAKLKSPFTLTDAVEIGTLHKSVCMEFHSTEGDKTSNKNEEGGKASTTVHYTENIGRLEYMAWGHIDVNELQFLPDSPAYDRTALSLTDGSENEQWFLKCLKIHTGMENPKLDYYYSEHSYHQDEWGERGVLYDKETVSNMIKRTLKLILGVEIYRKKAYFRTKELTIRVISNNGRSQVLTFTPDQIDEIDDLVFEYHEKYKLCSDEKIRENTIKFEEFRKQKKADAAKAEKEAKAKKTSENLSDSSEETVDVE